MFCYTGQKIGYKLNQPISLNNFGFRGSKLRESMLHTVCTVDLELFKEITLEEELIAIEVSDFFLT